MCISGQDKATYEMIYATVTFVSISSPL